MRARLSVLSVALAVAIVGNLGAQSSVKRGFGPLTPFGLSGTTATACGYVGGTVTAVGTDANTNEKDLWSFTIPANALGTDARGVRVTVEGTTAATATTKTIRLYYNGGVIRTIHNGASNNESWFAQSMILRTGAAAQNTFTLSAVNGNAFFARASTTADTTAASIVKVTGQNGTGNLNDIVFRSAVVECIG